MSAFDMNDQIMTGVLKGMGAAASRFEERMNALRENSEELKRSEFFYNYGMNLAKRVDELESEIKKHHAAMKEKEALLERSKEREQTFRTLSSGHAEYLDLVVKRLVKVEDILQRQSAQTFALDAFRIAALQELKNLSDPSASVLLDDDKRKKFLNEAWNKFMQTTNVKRGIPRVGVDQP